MCYGLRNNHTNMDLYAVPSRKLKTTSIICRYSFVRPDSGTLFVPTLGMLESTNLKFKSGHLRGLTLPALLGHHQDARIPYQTARHHCKDDSIIPNELIVTPIVHYATSNKTVMSGHSFANSWSAPIRFRVYRTHPWQAESQTPPRTAARVAGNAGRFIWGQVLTLLVTATSSMQFFMVTPDSFLKDRALFVWMAPVDPVLPDLLQSLSLSWQGKAITCPSKPQVVSVQLQAELQHWGGAGWLQCCHSLAEVTTIVLLHDSQELRMSCLFVTRSPVITFPEPRFVWLKWVLIRCGIVQLSMMLWGCDTSCFAGNFCLHLQNRRD